MMRIDLDTALCGCGEDMELLEYVYKETYVKVCAVCYSVLKDRSASQDAAQDTYIRLTEKYKKYKKGTDPLAFILKVAINVAKEHRRKLFGFIPIDSVTEKGNEGGMDRVISDMYTEKMLSHLDEKQRVTVILHLYTGLTFEEIANVTGTHLNTAKYRYKKAMDILKEKMV